MATEATSTESPPLHVVLFPFLARGHVPAFLRLATLLRALRPGLDVTLVSTPHILSSLTLPPSSLPVRLHALPFSPADHGLPAGAHSLADLQVHQFIAFFRASESLRPAFDHFVSTLRGPTCIIADAFFAWTADVARGHGAVASHAVFLPGGAFGNAVFFSVWEHLPHHALTDADADADEFPLLPDFPDVVLHRTQIPRFMLAATGADPWSAFFRRVAASCRATDAVLVNTVAELEPAGLHMLRRSFGAPTWPVGPVLAEPSESPDDDAAIIRWLDARAARSVLYVCFGSQSSVTAAQTAELTLGLEASGVAFVWVVRPPLERDAKEGFDPAWLPAGLSCGVPMLGWPLGAEQFFNAKLVVEWGVCVEVARGNVEGSKVTREAVAEAVRMVMGETGKGGEMRRNAASVSRAMAAAWEEPTRGSSAESLEGFLRSVETAAGR
ncbi:hypothetical protein PR202_gb15103 [Eleusine coracana subsp. coracana]|uniref:Uncharacterized protein n=1 Tax=Eleusine coracana subsp. coracana TaxID=191504 RepID=A0AAV5EXE2_ELECO|nr:hypothetical protein PR202_gb15103 [Eleusine coracana subsp. coracana]